MLSKMTLGQKIILFSSIFLFILFATLSYFTLNKVYNYSKSQAYDLALHSSRYNGQKLENYFKNIKTLGESIANQSETLVNEKTPSRDIVISTMKKTLDTYDFIFGITVAYEPNKFDGNDSNNLSSIGSSPNGRFIPYVTRDDNAYSIEPAFYDDNTKKQKKWYSSPMNSKRVYLTEPTTYSVQNKLVTMASISVPIIRNNETVGVVSIDASLDYLQKEISNYKPMGGFSQVISSEGTYVVSGDDNSKIMKNISHFDKEHVLLQSESKNKEFYQVYTSKDSSEKLLEVYTPINIEESDEYWTYISVIPISNIFKDYNIYLNIILYSCLLILSFIIYINYLIITMDL